MRAAVCDSGHAGALVTDHHCVRCLHWVIPTCNPAALPLRMQLLEKANFICFSSPALLQLVSSSRLPGVNVFFSILLQKIILGANFDHPCVVDTLSEFAGMRRMCEMVTWLCSYKRSCILEL